MSAKSGLGRGFDSLIPQNFDTSLLLDESERIQKLPVEVVQPNSGQPRQTFDDDSLHELADSIRAHGILQPLVVTAVGDGKNYRIVAGERRWRAAKLAKLATVPAIVRSLKELEELEIALVENVQRVDLSPLEQAVSIVKLHEQFSIPYAEIGKRLGKSAPTISNITRLLQLSLEAQQALIQERITEGHARAILALTGEPVHQNELLKFMLRDGWSVRQSERYVHGVKAGVGEVKAVKARMSTETPQTKQLAKRFEAPVQIRRMAKGGKIEIGFTGDDDLERLMKLLGQ